MSAAPIQLPLPTGGSSLPFDPRQLAELTTPERGQLYSDLGLDVPQREVAEEAVRLVLRRSYGGRR